ncbi:MAG: PTS sugar transporter subunit IIA [Sporolactobacillus sp.]
MDKSLFDERDIFVHQTFHSRDDFYDFVTAHLLDENKIKPDYRASIIQREKNFPTGLNTGAIKVAIPHTDYTRSNTTQIIVTTLAQPIKFHQMDCPERTIDVSIILLILFDKPQKQLAILQQMMEIVQNQQTLNALLVQKDKQSIIKILESIGG